MTDLAAEIAAMRGEMAELRQQNALLADRLARRGGGNVPQVQRQVTRPLAEGYEHDPLHHPRFLAALNAGAGPAALAALEAEVQAEISAMSHPGPVSPAEIEARERAARTAGMADLAAAGRAMMPMSGPQVSFGEPGQPVVTGRQEVTCENGHGRPRAQPAAKFCPVDGMPFLTADQHREAEDAALAAAPDVGWPYNKDRTRDALAEDIRRGDARRGSLPEQERGFFDAGPDEDAEPAESRPERGKAADHATTEA